MQANWGGLARKSQVKKARKTDSRCSDLAGQRTCSHVTSCNDCCDWMWIGNTSSSPIFSWYGSFGLLSVPQTEIPSSWNIVWKQWRRHRGSKQVPGAQGQGLLCSRDKKARTEMGWMHCLEGRLYWIIMVKLSVPDSPKYKGSRIFWQSRNCLTFIWKGVSIVPGKGTGVLDLYWHLSTHFYLAPVKCV